MAGPATAMLRRAQRNMLTLPDEIVEAGVKILQRELKRTIASATGGDGRMSGMGNSSVRPMVDVQSTGRISISSVRPARRTTGMFVILEDGTDAHDIRSRARRRQPPRPSEAMRIGDEWATGPWRVRGTSGKRVWSRAVTIARPQIARAQAQLFSQGVTR